MMASAGWVCLVLLTLASSVLSGLFSFRPYCQISWRIYHSCNTRVYEQYCIEDTMDLFHSKLYDKDRCKTVLLGMPYISNMSHYFVRDVVSALTYRCEFNIIVLDTSKTNGKFWLDYVVTIRHTYRDSSRYANALNNVIDRGLLKAKCLVAVGFSLGGQLVAQVCRKLEQKCCHLYAIDASGPMYDRPSSLTARLFPYRRTFSMTDACKVVSVICNRGFKGTLYSTAHFNVIVNSGIVQPNCIQGSKLGCSHETCSKIWADSVVRPRACQAKSKDNEIFYLGLPSHINCGSCDYDDKVIFHLRTAYDKPLCLGD